MHTPYQLLEQHGAVESQYSIVVSSIRLESFPVPPSLHHRFHPAIFMPPKGAPGNRGRGRGGPSTRGAPPPTNTSVVRQTLAPASHVRAIGVKRPGHGTSGRVVEIFTNHFATELNHGTICHYDGTHFFPFSEKRI